MDKQGELAFYYQKQAQTAQAILRWLVFRKKAIHSITPEHTVMDCDAMLNALCNEAEDIETMIARLKR